MSNKIQGDLSDYIAAPILQGIVNVAVAQTVVIIDLTTMAGWPGNQVNGVDVAQVGGVNKNPLAHYLSVQADGGSVNVAFAALATTLSAITTTATTSITNNQLATSYTANGTVVIPSGTERAWLLPAGPNPQPGATSGQLWGGSSPARFIGLIAASGTTTVRLWQSSP